MIKTTQSYQPIRINPPNSYEKIIQLLSCKEKTFIFIHNKNKYFANPITVCHYSRKINSILMSDPYFNEYIVSDYDGDFQIIADYFQNGKIEFNENNALFLLNVGCDLQIDDLVTKSFPHIEETFFLKNTNNILQDIYFSGANMENLLILLSSHFNELSSTDFLEKLPIPFINLILHSPSLNAEPQDLLNFLSKIINWKKNPNHALAKYLPLEIIPKNEIRCYLNDYRLNLNHHRLNIFNSFQITDKKINNSDISMIKADLPPPIETDEIVPGIIQQIAAEYLFKKLPISFSSSSIAYPTDMQESYGPEILLSGDKVQYFCTQQGTKEWLEVDFADFKVFIWGYALRSWRGASNGVCPISWILEASNDHIEWIIIDQKENVLDLANDNGCFLTSTNNTDWYKFFRFTQLETKNEGNSSLALSGFEIYGVAKMSI